MSEWTIYNKGGDALMVVKRLDYHGEFMGESNITFDVESAVPVPFSLGDYLTYRGERYTLREIPAVEKVARRGSYGGAFKYENVTLRGMEWEAMNIEFTDYVPSDNNIHYTGLSQFSFYCDHPRKLLERIQACMDVAYKGEDAWTFVLSEDVDLSDFRAETIDISSGTSCWSALALMYSKWKIPFVRNGRTVTVGATALVTSATYEYGKGNGLLSIKRVLDTDKSIVTRLRAYGSDKNMPYRYYNNKGYINESMYMPYLMLPSVREHQSGDGHDVYLQSDNAADYGIIDAEVRFDGNGDNEEIYPTLEGMTAEDAGISTVTYGNDGNLDEIVSCSNPLDNGVVADGNYDADDPQDTEGVTVVKTFEIIVPWLGFDWHDKLTSDGTATIIMKSGMCSAREFEVLRYDPVSTSDVSRGVRLTLNRAQDDITSYVFPNKNWKIEDGDKYIITGIEMPDTYVIAAENRLLTAAEAWLADNDHPNYRYEPSINNIWLKEHPEDASQLVVGNRLSWTDDDLGTDGGLVSGDITIMTLNISEGKAALPEYEITLNDTVSTGTIEQLTAQVDAIMSGFAGGGGLSLEQVLTQIRNVGGKQFLSKLVTDVAQGVITFVKGVLFGDGRHGIDGNGNATLNDVTVSSARTEGYTGTDIVSDRGFRVWEDSEGKSHVITDFLTARVRAFFASLEIRKTEHSAGNRIESPAGNTFALVKKFDASGNEIKPKWHARRYGFYRSGGNWVYKMVHRAGAFLGVWKEDEEAEVAFYRCYWTSEDKEEKKAVENNWRVGDQAFCQTFNLRALRGYVQNKRYWRLVEAVGYDTIDGQEYAYIDLSNRENVEVEYDGSRYPCKGYEKGTTDAPAAGDDVACLGNQITPQTRGGAIQYITYGEVDGTTGIPCVKMYSGINGYDLESHVIEKRSPRGVYMRADSYHIESASGTGESSPLYCQRGAWYKGAVSGHYDVWQHRGSTWLCTVPMGTTTISEPSADTPAEWSVFASRGGNAPQAVADSATAIVSASSEGRITGLSAVTGLPTKVEVYIDGEKVSVSDWDLGASYAKYRNRQQAMDNSSMTLAEAITIDSFKAGTDSVGIRWIYTPVQTSIDGSVVIHPVIEATEIVLHVVFTHNGETLTAETSLPMIVQRAGADGKDGADGKTPQAQYSADNSEWHDDLRQTDIYVRYSYDGGATWTAGIRFVGKSIEFERGVRHFAHIKPLTAYIDSIEANYAPQDLGYYLCDTDEDGNDKATLWLYEGGDARDLVNVPITDEVNYFLSWDGHLWNADENSASWADMGKIQGADGVDGVSITLDPGTVIFEQSENDTSTFGGLPFSATVRVWKGATPLQPSAYKVEVLSMSPAGCCEANAAGNVVTISKIGKDAEGNYHTSGKVTVRVTYNGSDTDLTLNWAANLLGTWKLNVEEATMTAVSAMTFSYYDDNGDIRTAPLSTVLGQDPKHIFATVEGLKGRTGIDIADGRIDLMAGRVNFLAPDGTENSKVSIDPTTGTLHAVDGVFEGTLNAMSYQTRYADLVTHCYSRQGGNYDDRVLVPGYHKAMYDAEGNALDIEGFWNFRVGAQDMTVWLPTNIDLTGQRIVLYNPYIGYLRASHATKVVAGEIDTDGGDMIYGTNEPIRGVGLPVSTTDPVLIDQYEPVEQILFCDGIVELQCVPGGEAGKYEWCVVNIGTNLVSLSEEVT